MGRSSVSGLVITVFGSTGFVGRYLVNRLGQTGARVVIPYRGNEYDMWHLKQMGDVGQIVPIRFHLRDYGSIYNAVKDSRIVINLLGQDRTSFNFTPEQVNGDGAAAIAKACQEAQVDRLIHISSIMANPNSKSRFLRSKALGEELLHRDFPQTIISRPSVLFGHEDRFLNAIGLFSSLPLGYPLLQHGKQLRSPLYVGDFCEALYRLCLAKNVDGRTFDMMGPRQYSAFEITKYIASIIGRPNPIVSVPAPVLWMWARIFPEWRRPLYTWDMVKALSEDEQYTPGNATLKDLGLTSLHSLEELAIQFVRIFRKLKDFGQPVSPSSPSPMRGEDLITTSLHHTKDAIK